jgi:flagellar hook-associated protein 3 FlgL
MTSTFISTSALSEATRSSLMKLQTKLAQAQKEVATGRLADVGLSLGFKTGQAVSLRQEHARLQSITETNGLVASRLDATQAALQSLVDAAQSFESELLGARNSDTGPKIIQGQARTALSAFADTLNTAFNGASLFAGINADVRPITDYNGQPPPANAQAVATAFASAFGVSQSDPAVFSISDANMQAFLDGPFAGLFDPAGWGSTWSAASDQNVKSRISTNKLIETSVNANDAAFRKLASAYTMLADLGTEKLNQSAFQAVVDTAARTVSEAVRGISELQSSLGTAQERVEHANGRMSIQIDIMAHHIGVLEGVDPYEASNRLAGLLAQVETAYAMTARIQKLSLLDYLPIA